MLDLKTEREVILIALNALRALLVRANDPQDAVLLGLVDEVRKGYGQ